MIRSNNYTIFGIHSTAERYSWAAYHFFVLLSSLIGDTLILLATVKKDAFKLNKQIVTVIQYIAVSDLAFALTVVLPGALSLIANTWVLGGAMCSATVSLAYFIYLAGMSLIAVLTTSKFLLLKDPLRSANLTKKTAHQICSIALIPSLTVPISMLIVDKDDVGFNYITYNCKYWFRADIWKKVVPTLSILTMFIPNIVIIATTIPTLVIAKASARRVGGSVPWQGTMAVALTAVVYCISTLPLFVFYIGKDFANQDPESTFQFHYYRISFFMSLINIMSNFYIYAMTIRSFRRFLFSKILSNLTIFSRISLNMTSSTGRDE